MRPIPTAPALPSLTDADLERMARASIQSVRPPGISDDIIAALTRSAAIRAHMTRLAAGTIAPESAADHAALASLPSLPALPPVNGGGKDREP